MAGFRTEDERWAAVVFTPGVRGYERWLTDVDRLAIVCTRPGVFLISHDTMELRGWERQWSRWAFTYDVVAYCYRGCGPESGWPVFSFAADLWFARSGPMHGWTTAGLIEERDTMERRRLASEACKRFDESETRH